MSTGATERHIGDAPAVGSVSVVQPRARPLGAPARALLVPVEGFLGIGALYGGWNLLSDAEGFGMEASWLDGTPFPDYTIPGLVLLVVIGGGMLAAAALAAAGSRYAALAALAMGVTMLGYLAVETLLIGYQGARQIPLVATVATAALVLLAVGWSSVRQPQGHDGDG